MYKKLKILYLQHAGSLGGSSMSLLYTMQGMRELGHTCIVALIRPSVELEQLYSEAGFETISWPKLALWDHSAGAPRPWFDPRTSRMYVNVMAHWRSTFHYTLELIKLVQPDIVHLNSMTFSPSANALINENVPFVWHVREPPPDQGWRTAMIRRIMLRAPQLIFISDYDRQQWVNNVKGEVIYNFVNLEQFQPDLVEQSLRKSSQISPAAKVILYLGGVSSIKGVFVLLESLHMLKQRGEQFVCLMPGTTVEPAKSISGNIASVLLPLIGSGTPKQKVRQSIEQYNLHESIRLYPFVNDIVPFFAISDVVVFPSTKPHFARPVVESIAMHKPTVGSDLGGVRELLDHHPLGWCVPPNNPTALANAIQEALSKDHDYASVHNQFCQAKSLFDRDRGVKAIATVYHRLLERDDA